jgi:signal peptidase I
MKPTLYTGDRVFVNIIGMRITQVKHSDIIVFTPSIEPDSFYIKRIIGLPGDTVKIKGGKVSVNGTELNETYLAPGTATSGDLEINIPEGKIFVMGDNRGSSEDSRDPRLGPVPIKSIKGKAVFRLFPINDIKKL